jgi:hypothetical protein
MSDEVRNLELATQLVTGPLAGDAIVSILDDTEVAETIRAVGELLAAITERCREQIRKGERWGRRSRLTGEEGQKVLWGMTMDQLWAFAQRWDYSLDEGVEWAREQRDIPHGALVALSDVNEMAKIMGEAR